jgi:hypothetical protein
LVAAADAFMSLLTAHGIGAGVGVEEYQGGGRLVVESSCLEIEGPISRAFGARNHSSARPPQATRRPGGRAPGDVVGGE